MKKRDPFLVTVFAIAAASRLAFLFIWKFKNLETVFPYDPYPTVALGWLGWGTPIMSIVRAPLYPGVLAALFWIFTGARDWMVPILQCLLSAYCPILLFYWARRVGPEVGAKIAAVWMAIDPPLIFFAPQYQTETLYIFMMLAFFSSVYRTFDTPTVPKALGTGIVGGLASLTRGVFLAYSVWFAAAAALMKEWKVLMWVATGWFLAVAPWTARNWMYYHKFIPISVQSGWNMYEGFTLDLEELKKRPYAMAAEVQKARITDPIAVDEYFQKKINRWVNEHPKEAAKIVFVKLFRFWRPWPYDPYSKYVRWAIGTYLSILLTLAALGMRALRGIKRRLYPVYGLFIALTLMHAFYFTSLRYRLPLEPFLIFFGAIGFADIWSGSLWAKKQS